MLVLLTIAAIVLLYGVVSKPLDARGVTSALVFTVAGVVAGTWVLGIVDVNIESATAERVTELALVLLLFSDAARLDLRHLRRQIDWPLRLLLIGLPLTIVAGVGVGALLFPGMALASVVLLATMLCSTDAALGQRVISDDAVPDRVRQTLDVESGLNDGLAVPFFLVAADVAMAELTTGVTWAVVKNAAEQIGWGVLAGVAAGALGGGLYLFADRRGWLEGQWRQVVTLAAALLAYAAAVELGGSGFIAAFVGGMTFGAASRQHGLRVTLFVEETGDLLAAAVWIGFGAVAVAWAWPHVTWQIVAYALLSLTVVRMVPVAIAMTGKGVRWPTVAFIGWFGPRGLASIVFGLLALERGVPESETLLTTVVVTVVLSVVLHGLTSVPLIGAYRRWYDGHTEAHPLAPEAAVTEMPRQRHRLGGDELGAWLSHWHGRPDTSD
jgi:sodium/hydrogen antiporter